jgi:hypothetical protein
MPTLEELQKAGGVPVAPAGSMTLEQLQAQGGTAVEPQEQEEPGRLEALGRGALQGVTFGFGDEIQGALESIFTDKTYQRARDEARQANARAQQAHSGFYGGGEIAGGIAGAFVPGLDIAEGAGLGTVATKSALAGALGGVGTSEATDVGGLAQAAGTGALEGAAGGAIAHGVGKGLGKVLGGAEAKETSQAIKGLAAGEGKVPAAALSASRKLTDNETVPALIHEPVGGTTIAREAYKPAEHVNELVQAKKAEIGHGLDAIYDKADQASGGVKVSDLVKHYDDEIAKLSTAPGNRGAIKALEETRDDALKSWAPKLADALGSEGADNPSTKALILKTYDATVPSKEVRKFATTLQDRGSTTEANPKLATQIRQQLGSVTKDFVNGHVEKVLGGEDRAALEGLNARMSAAYTVERALEDRAVKEAGGRVSQQGNFEKLLHGGGNVAAGMSLMHGNIPGAVAALAIPKAIEAAPKVGRFATSQAAKANQVLTQVLEAAKQGVPWAQAQIRMLRQTPVGAARLAQIAAQTVSAPVDQQAQEAQ